MRLALLFLGLSSVLLAQDKPLTKEQQIARVYSLLNELVNLDPGETTERTLEEHFAAIEAAMPKGKKLSIRIDREGLGKDFPRVQKATVRAVKQMNVSVARLLRRSLGAHTVEGVELDYSIRSTGVVLTRAKLAAETRTYDVRDIMDQMPRLLPRMRAEDDLNIRNKDYSDVALDDLSGNLVRYLSHEVEFRSWETVEVFNGTRLKIHATPFQHSDVADALFTLRRLTDLHVCMNARLYEVDQAFYKKEIAPLFAKVKESPERAPAIPIDIKLLKKVLTQKLILESDELKLIPDRRHPFLAKHTTFRFDGGATGFSSPERKVRTGLEGFTFDVLPNVSLEHQKLRLNINQHVVRMTKLERVKKRDPATGKDDTIEVPHLKKTTLSATVQVDDGWPFVMRVDYQPQEKEKQDKVWLLVARPMIWIEMEQEFWKKDGKKPTPRSVWDKEPEKPLVFPTLRPGKPLPLNDETKEILQAILTDVLTNKDFKSEREFYGTEADRKIILENGETHNWPKDFKPNTHGYKIVRPDRFEHPRRVLGIRVDGYSDIKLEKQDRPYRVISICLFNAGGSDNGAVIGGCTATYNAQKIGNRWKVQCESVIDP